MKHTCWCYACGEIHTEIKNSSIAGSCCDWGDNHHKTCSWKKSADDFFNTLTNEENMSIKQLLTHFNSFKTMKEYLENDKDIEQINQTGFFNPFPLSNQAKQIFEQLRIKHKKNIKREREREKFCLKCRKSSIDNQWVDFCGEKCANLWLNENLTFETILGTFGENKNNDEVGKTLSRCKNCRQKISEWKGEIDDKLIQHVVECKKNKEVATCKKCGKYPIENDYEVLCICGWKTSGCNNCQYKVDKQLQEHQDNCQRTKKKQQIEIIFEKVLARCPEEAFKPLAEENGKKQWCVYTPIWVKRITKEEAEELKNLCQGADPKKDFRYTYWVSQDNKKYDFEKTLPQFIQELDKIIEQGEESDNKSNNNPQSPHLNQSQKSQYLPTLQNVQQYFIANNIHSITNQNGNLVITFNTNANTTPPSQTITDEELSETSTVMDTEQKSMWRKFKDYLKNKGKSKMDKKELEQEINELSQPETEKPSSKAPWLIFGGIGIVAILGIVIAFVLVRKEKNKIRKEF